MSMRQGIIVALGIGSGSLLWNFGGPILNAVWQYPVPAAVLTTGMLAFTAGRYMFPSNHLPIAGAPTGTNSSSSSSTAAAATSSSSSSSSADSIEDTATIIATLEQAQAYQRFRREINVQLREMYRREQLSMLPNEILIDRDKGVQNAQNSCAIASLLQSIYLTTNFFDHMTLVDRNSDTPIAKKIKALLRDIVNDLRRNQFVPGKKLANLRNLVMSDSDSFQASEDQASEEQELQKGELYESEIEEDGVSSSSESEKESEVDSSESESESDSVASSASESEEESEVDSNKSELESSDKKSWEFLDAEDFWKALMEKLNPKFLEVEIIHAAQNPDETCAQATAGLHDRTIAKARQGSGNTFANQNIARQALFITTPRTKHDSSNYQINPEITLDGAQYILRAVIGYQSGHNVSWFGDDKKQYYFDSHYLVDESSGEVISAVFDVSKGSIDAQSFGKTKMQREATLLIYIRKPQA